MKQLNTILSTFICIVLFFVGCLCQDRAQLGKVVDQQGMITQEVKDLLRLTGLTTDGTLQNTITVTQQAWLRKPNQERWDIEKYVTENEAELRSVFDKLGMCKAIMPLYQEYDYVCILGALFGRIKTRLQYAIELYNQGIRFKKLVFLSGARPVVPEQGENMQNYMQSLSLETIDDVEPLTEAEIMKFIYKYISMPDDMRQLPVQFVDTPMVQTGMGTRRPATDDIINEWLATNPMPGRCLFVSNQPYVGFQDAVIKTYMPSTFIIDTVGCECVSTLNIGIILDNVARWLYQEGKRQK